MIGLSVNASLSRRDSSGDRAVTEDEDLICAYIFDGQGFGRQVGWPEIRAKAV